MEYFEFQRRMWPHVRSECSLESQSLSNADITSQELIACLQLMSLSLRNLSLSTDTSKHTYVIVEVLQLLTSQSTIPERITTVSESRKYQAVGFLVVFRWGLGSYD